MRSILTKSNFSRILGSKVGVRVLYSCGLYSAVYGKVQFRKDTAFVIQRYIDKPFLLEGGRKFDIRYSLEKTQNLLYNDT